MSSVASKFISDFFDSLSSIRHLFFAYVGFMSCEQAEEGDVDTSICYSPPLSVSSCPADPRSVPKAFAPSGRPAHLVTWCLSRGIRTTVAMAGDIQSSGSRVA